MAIQTTNGGLWLPSPDYRGQANLPTFSVATIDAADEGLAVMLRIPKTGNIVKVLWATRTVTTGSTITIRGETFDETVGPSQPSGTLFHANFNGTSVIADANDNIAVLTTLAGAVPVTIGDKVALVIKQPAASFGNMQVAVFADDTSDFPYATLNTGVSPAVAWNPLVSAPVIALEYDDGSYAWISGCHPFHLITTTTFNNSSTPDEIGLRFKVPFPCRAAYWWAWLDADGDFNANLYDSDGATKIAGTPVATNKNSRAGAIGAIQVRRFTSPATLLANTYYRFAIEPSSATNLSVYDFTVNTAAVMDSHPGGQNFHLTSAKNPAAEGDWTNTLTRRPFMGIGFDGFDDGLPDIGLIGGGLIR